MSAHCQIAGRATSFGNTVSHSHRRTKGIKVIDRDGIEAVVRRLRQSGQRI